MRNKMLKSHINMPDFLRENKYGMDKIEDLAERACEIWNAIKSEINPSNTDLSLEDRLTKHGISEYLSERSISLLTSNRDIKYFFDVPKCPSCGRYAKVNIFGYLKLGERSVGELSDDVLNLYTYDEKHDTRYFDLDRAILVGLKFKPLEKSAAIMHDSMNVVFDVDATMIRALTSPTVISNEEDVDKAILRTMVDKLVVMNIGRFQLASIIDNYLRLYKHSYEGEENSRWHDLKDILKVVFIYKLWYNAINCLDDIDIEKSVESILDLVNLASRSFNATQAISDVYNTIHSKLVNGTMDVERYPDRMIRKCIDFYRTAMNYYSYRDDNGRRSHAQYVNNKVVVGVESVVFESFIADIVTPGFRDKKRSSRVMLGIESLDPSKREFEEFKRNSRAAILAKLEYKERITFIRYESDVMKYKAEAIGCRTEFTKSTILKRGETLGRMITMELGRPNHSEEFVVLMSMLDSERVSIQSELASRDLYKERMTMLNGSITTKNEWNY